MNDEMVHHILDGIAEPVDEGPDVVWHHDDPEPDLPHGYELRDSDGDTWALGPHGWSLQVENTRFASVPVDWITLRRHAPLTGPSPDDGEAR